MAKTITQETMVLFGHEQEEWKAAILAELESFANLGVYEPVRLVDVRGAKIPEGEKGKKKTRIVSRGTSRRSIEMIQ